MASTYSTNLRLELIGTGDQQGAWGNTTNNNLGTLLEEAIGGYVAVDATAGNVTLTTVNGASDQSRNMVVNVTGTPGTTRNVICPAIRKIYIVKNSTDSNIVFKTASQSPGVTIPVGSTSLTYVNGTDVVSVTGSIAPQNANSVSITGGSITGITDLAVADGGTGASSLTGYVKGNGTSAFTASGTIPSTDISGIGTISSQNSNNVSITGGSITGITDLAVADGGTGVSSITGIVKGNGSSAFSAAVAGTDYLAPGAVGSLAAQNANNVTITGGSITGITDLAVADGGTGASTLTGYVKGNGTSAFTASNTIPNTDISGLGTLSTQDGTFSGTSSGTNTGDQNIFQTIAVAGQSDVVADTTTDTLTLVAGSGITLTTNATSDSITIAATSGGGGTVTSVAVSGGTTGLTTSGGPITTSGTITIAGTLGAANGGTGATTLTGYVRGNGTSAFTASSTIPNTAITGLGTMSTQNANNVAITGGYLQTSKTNVEAPVSTDGNIFSGTYTPTLTDSTNVGSSTAYKCQYMRVGNVVTVSGRVGIDPTTADVATELFMSLPVTASLVDNEDLAGVFASSNSGTGNCGNIRAATATETALFSIVPDSNALRSYFFTFTYLI